MVVSLLDAYTRQQIFLEEYKNGLDARMRVIVEAIGGEITTALYKANVDNLGDLRKGDLRRLITRVNRIVIRMNNRFTRQVLRELEDLAATEAALAVRVMEHTEGTTKEEAHQNGLGAPILAGLLAFQQTQRGRAHLWVWVRNQIDPASGFTVAGMAKQYTDYVGRHVVQLVRRGFAEKWSIADAVKAIVGTSARRYKDGFVARAVRNNRAALHTMAQHVSSQAQAAVASLFYEWYEWVAVIDDRTSNICLGRDGKKYRYGEGPLPPAHYMCRSRAVPLKKTQTYNDNVPTFYEWIKGQPVAVQNSILGVRTARGLRAGTVKASNLTKFRARGTLTLKQLADKYTLIVTV